MSIILLTTFLAIAQEDSAVTISAKDDGRIVAECPDCRDNIITHRERQTDAFRSALEALKVEGSSATRT